MDRRMYHADDNTRLPSHSLQAYGVPGTSAGRLLVVVMVRGIHYATYNSHAGPDWTRGESLAWVQD